MPTEATGGTITVDGDYTVHKFLAQTNFLTGGTASVSSSAAGSGASVVDGNRATYWASANNNNAEWWKYDLGSGVSKTATKMRVFKYWDVNGGIFKAFKLQGSNNDSIWTDLLSTDAATHSDYFWEDFFFTNTTAYRYYRVLISSNYRSGDYYKGMSECELFESEKFTPFKAGNVSCLVVAGGGSGGSIVNGVGGGGGAGGLIYSAEKSVTVQAYNIDVGKGGAAVADWGNIGAYTKFDDLIAVGGGGGGRKDKSSPQKNGGSGGGAGQWSSDTGGTGSQGYDGGDGNGTNQSAGCGGGGAGQEGQAVPSDNNGGYGGDGLQYDILVDGVDVFYAGGGGGGGYDGNGGVGGAGGDGGGGEGEGTATNGHSGTDGLGGGGGGARSGYLAGGGGSGVVIIRYLTSTQSGGFWEGKSPLPTRNV